MVYREETTAVPNLSLTFGKGGLLWIETVRTIGAQGRKSCKLRLLSQESLLIHIFMDTVSVELFTDDYTTAFSTNIYPEETCTELYVRAEGGGASFLSFETWGMRRVCR